MVVMMVFDLLIFLYKKRERYLSFNFTWKTVNHTDRQEKEEQKIMNELK